MSNLLPKESRKAVRSMYRARFIIAASLAALLTAGFSALSLLPGYLALHAAESVTIQPSLSKSGASSADRAAIASIQAMLKALSPLVATTTPTAVIIHALSLRPSNITVDHITYPADNPGTILLAGSAATREALDGYRQALSAAPLWKTVSVPVGNLTGEPGARFSITLTGAF